MDEEDYACDKFVPQRIRTDTCRRCYQPLKMHKHPGSVPSANSLAKEKPASSPPRPRPSPPTMSRDSRSPSVEGRPPLLRSSSYVKSAGDSVKRRTERSSGSSPPMHVKWPLPARPPPPLQSPPPIPPPPALSPEPSDELSVAKKKLSELLPIKTRTKAPPEAHGSSVPLQMPPATPQPTEEARQAEDPAPAETLEPQKEETSTSRLPEQPEVPNQSVAAKVVDEDIVLALDEGVTESAPPSVAAGDSSKDLASPLQSGEVEHQPVEQEPHVNMQDEHGSMSKDVPQHSDALPQGNEAMPQGDEAMPQGDEAMPQGDEAMPQGDEAKPQDSEAMPQDDEAEPRDSEAMPRGDEAKPRDSEAMPQGDEAMSHGDEAMPQDCEATPQDNEAMPQDSEATPQDNEAKPRDSEAMPQGDEAKPQDGEAMPQDNEAMPQGDEAMPQGDKAKPQDGEAMPQNNEAMPQGDEAMPQGDEAMPQGDEAKPQDSEAMPQDDEAMPQGDEAMPQGDEAKPRDSEAMPQDSEAMPQDSEAMPQDDEAMPRGDEAMPRGDEAMPQGAEAMLLGDELHDLDPAFQGFPAEVPPPPPLPPQGFPTHPKSLPSQREPHTPPSSPTGDRPRPGSPRPPPLGDHSALLAEIRLGRALQHVTPPTPTPPVQAYVHDAVMAAIRRGVQLNAAPRPLEGVEREKVLDISSELRKMQKKRRKQEADERADRIDEYSTAFRELGDNIRQLYQQGMPHLQQLRHVVAEARALLQRAEIPEELLSRRLRWPSEILYPYTLTVDEIAAFEQKIDQMNRLVHSYMEAKASGNVHVNSELIEQYAKDVVKMGTTFHRLIEHRELHENDAELIMARAGDVLTPLMDMLYEKAFAAHQTAVDPTMRRYEGRFKANFAMDLLRVCCTLTEKLSTYAHIRRHDCFLEAQAKLRELEQQSTGSVSGEGGNAPSVDDTDAVAVGATAEREENTSAITQDLRMALQSGSAEAVIHALENTTSEKFFALERSLLIAAVETRNFAIVDAVLQVRQKMAAQSEDPEERKHDFDWVCEAASKGYHDILEHLVRQWNMDINSTSPEAGNTPLHLAARKADMAMMGALIRLGANPLALNSTKRTPLQLLAIKHFPAHSKSTSVEPKEPLFDLSVYVNNPSLSDVVLISEDGKRFHAHRLVLCAQSAVFKAMMASQEWGTNKRSEVKLSGLEAKVVRALLQYLYTGKCLFALEDLNLGVELMAAADQFLLESMRHQCEAFLSEQVDHEVVIPLYYAATHHSAPTLLNAACHHLLVHYNKVDDKNHTALLDLLDSSEFSKPNKGSKFVTYKV